MELFEAGGDRLAGSLTTSHVALGWSASSLVSLPKCDQPLVGVAFGVLDPRNVFRSLEGGSPLVLRDACALFLASGRDLLLARGPFGGRPLYFAMLDDGDTVVACSDLLPVVVQLRDRADVDIDGLAAIVSTSDDGDPTRTAYAQIRKVDSCQVVLFTAGRKRVSVQVPPPPAMRTGNIGDLAAEFREVLVETIARDARGLSQATVMTGGGLDSSAVLAAAKLGYRQGRHACLFSAVAMDFAGPGDDRPHLRALCASLGMEALRVRPSDAVPLVPSVLTADAAPFYWPTFPVEMAAVSRAVRGGAEALFTGSAGDPVTGGDLSLYSEGVFGLRLLPALWGAARLQTMWPSSPSSRALDLVLRPAMRRVAPRSWLSRKRARRLCKGRQWAWAGPSLRAFLIHAEPERPQESWYCSMARSGQLLRIADLRGQFERKSGLVEHSPYLDAKLIEFVASVPREMRFWGHSERGLFREAMRGLLPESVRMRPDKASLEPMVSEVGSAAHGSGALTSLMNMEALGDLGLVQPVAFRSALTKAIAERDGEAWGYAWPALSAEAFLQHGRGSYRDAAAAGVGR